MVQSKPQQQTIAKKTDRVVGGGEQGPARVLMTIDLELTRRNGEQRPGGEGGIGKSEPVGFLSRLVNQLTFKK